MATSTSPNYHSSILIVGAGTWGCSTALHLARRGHRDITVLDAYDLPSPISAGNDINKIVEQGSFDSNPDDDSAFVSQQLLHLASQGWTSDPVFMPYYHDTGYIICAHTPDGLEQLIKREMLDQQADIEWLETPEAFRAAMPKGVLTGDFPGWKGGFKRTGAGWVFARGALSAAFIEAERLGVKFITGTEGNVTKLNCGTWGYHRCAHSRRHNSLGGDHDPRSRGPSFCSPGHERPAPTYSLDTVTHQNDCRRMRALHEPPGAL